MRNLTAGLVTTLSVVFVSAAFAADFPRAPPPRLIAPPPAYQPYPVPRVVNQWEGFYIGLNGGYGHWKRDETLTVFGVTGPSTGSGTGYFGGAQIGYNLQSGFLVGGLEADFQGTSLKGDMTAPGTTGSQKMPWFGTARGRIGFAFDRAMIYGTAGGVYGETKYEGTSFGAPFSNKADYYTWTVGGGLETMFLNRWSAKIEYLYLGTPSKSPLPPGTSAYDIKAHTDIVRAGINYRF